MEHKEFFKRMGQSKSPRKLAAIKENAKMPRFSKRAILAHLEGLLEGLEDFEGVALEEVREQGKGVNEDFGRWHALDSLASDIKNNRIKR